MAAAAILNFVKMSITPNYICTKYYEATHHSHHSQKSKPKVNSRDVIK